MQRDLSFIVGPGAIPPVDIFPILKHVPERWASWKTMAKNIKKVHRKLWYDLLDVIEKRVVEGRRQGCLMEDIWDNQEQFNFNREKMAYVRALGTSSHTTDIHTTRRYIGSNMLEAGSDTTSMFLQSFIAFITAHPEVQRRAQEEIDDAVGPSRSPSFEDWDSLPYLQAIVKEVCSPHHLHIFVAPNCFEFPGSPTQAYNSIAYPSQNYG